MKIQGYRNVVVNADYRTDGIGNVGPSSVTRNASGTDLEFDHDPQIIVPPESKRFLSLLTDVESHVLTGSITIYAKANQNGPVFRTFLDSTAAPDGPAIPPEDLPQVKLMGFATDEFGSGGILNFRVSNVPIGSTLRIEATENLREWGNADASPQTVVKVPTTFSVHVTDAKVAEYFRVVVDPPTIQFNQNNIALTAETPLDQVLIGLLRQTPDQQLRLRVPWSGDDIQDPEQPDFPMIPKGEIVLGNAEDLSTQLGLLDGLRLWETPPPKDDDSTADARYPPTTRDQGTIDRPQDLPGEDGKGRIDDGRNGDGIRIPPTLGAELEPGKFDMVFENRSSPEMPRGISSHASSNALINTSASNANSIVFPADHRSGRTCSRQLGVHRCLARIDGQRPALHLSSHAVPQRLCHGGLFERGGYPALHLLRPSPGAGLQQ